MRLDLCGHPLLPKELGDGGWVFLEQEGVVGDEGVLGLKVEGWPVPGEGVVGPVPVPGGGGRAREAGGGVYSG